MVAVQSAAHLFSLLASLTGNSVLCWLIHRDGARFLGAYGGLLQLQSCVDVLTALCYFTVQPQYHLFREGLVVVMRGVVGQRGLLGWDWLSVSLSLYVTPIAVMTLQIALASYYRFALICR